MKPRDYQFEAVADIFAYFAQPAPGNPLVAQPTGTGKSICIGEFVRQALHWYPTTRIVMTTHVKELIAQNLDKLLRLWPLAPVGVYSAGLKRREMRQITYAGIASVYKLAEDFGHVDLLVVDEAHLISDNDAGMYLTFIAGLRKINPNLRVIGFTATKFRKGMGLLTDGKMFDHICHDRTDMEGFNWFIDEGYLVNLIPKRTQYEQNVEQVSIIKGEFNQSELQDAVDDDGQTRIALREAIALAGDRHKWLVFCAGVKHAEHVADVLEEFGISAGVVHSKQKDEVNDPILKAHRRGDIRALVNVDKLTTGYDDPEIDCIIVLRPTRSPVLWVQMLGRGTRPLYVPGYDLETREGRLTAIAQSPKPDCLVLDFAGNTKRLGPINDPIIPNPKKKKRGGDAPYKVCELCDTYNHARATVCIACGEPFPAPEIVAPTASTAELIARGQKARKDPGKPYEPEVHEIEVDSVSYARHIKAGRPDSIKVVYQCGLLLYKTFVCIDHGGAAKAAARKFLRDALRPDVFPTPDDREAFIQQASVDQLLLSPASYLRAPRMIRVWTNTKPVEVLSHVYDS